MDELKCRNCGAPLTPTGKCEYCGSVYRIEKKNGHKIYVETVPACCQTIAAEYSIDRETYKHYPESFVAGQVYDNIARKMVEQLTQFIRFDKTTDPFLDKTLARGTLRVVDPNFTF